MEWGLLQNADRAKPKVDDSILTLPITITFPVTCGIQVVFVAIAAAAYSATEIHAALNPSCQSDVCLVQVRHEQGT
jgi:hypothetical protein